VPVSVGERVVKLEDSSCVFQQGVGHVKAQDRRQHGTIERQERMLPRMLDWQCWVK